MQNSTNMRILELLRFLYERTDENHPATVSDIIAHLNGKGIQAVRQTVYADTNALIDAGIDIVVAKSNLIFLSALKMLERLTADGRLSAAEQEAARRELERRLRPTLLFA